MTPLTPYQKRLRVFLAVATFFEGFDIFALSQVLPQLREEFGLGELGVGLIVGVANVGTVLAWLLVRAADRIGRKRVLGVTIVGYAIFTLLTALSPNAWAFAAFQLVARLFLIGEWGVAMVVAAEEFPADRRGAVLGHIQGWSSLGSVACAALVPILLKSPLGWRTVFVVGFVPLLAMAWARRDLRETARFAKVGAQQRPLGEILRGPYRGRVLELALMWALTYLCTQTGISFWKQFATSERGWTDAEVGGAMTVAAVVAMPLVFGVGTVLDRLGRRLGAILVFGAASAGVAGAYLAHHPAVLVASLILGMFGASAVLPVLNAYTTERFPTELRGDAFAWANNLLGRVTYVIGPIAVGVAAGTWGWGLSVAATAIGPFLALILLQALLPETRGQELEETARI
jgi:putative MFS transporter